MGAPNRCELLGPDTVEHVVEVQVFRTIEVRVKGIVFHHVQVGLVDVDT